MIIFSEIIPHMKKKAVGGVTFYSQLLYLSHHSVYTLGIKFLHLGSTGRDRWHGDRS